MRILCERQQDSLARDVSWLDHLIQEERAGKPIGAPPAGRPATAPGSGGQASQPLAGTAPVRLVPLASASQLQRTGPGLAAATSSRIEMCIRDRVGAECLDGLIELKPVAVDLDTSLLSDGFSDIGCCLLYTSRCV